MSYLQRIRRREGRIPDLIYRCYKATQHMNVPQVPGLYRFLSYEREVRQAGVGWIKRKFYDEPIFRLLCAECGPGLNLLCGIPLVLGELEIRIGEHVTLHGGTTTFVGAKVCDRPRLIIGDYTHCGSRLAVRVGADVTIGNHVLISDNVVIVAYDGHSLDPVERRENVPPGPQTSRPIRVCDNAWICSGAIITKGVTIGENSVVGAGAIVTRDVPPNVVVAGNPARIVRRLGKREDREAAVRAQQ